MDAKDWLIIYRLIKSSKNSTCTTTMKGLGKADFKVNPIAILTDNDWVIVFSGSHNPDKASERLHGEFAMEKVATIAWHDVLLFLHSSALPKEQYIRDGMFALFRILLDQKCPLHHLDVAKAKSLPILEVRSGPSNAKHDPLAKAMTSFLSSNPDNVRGLEHYLKGLRVEVSQSQVNKSQRDKVKTDTIAGLARLDDSHNCQKPFPARVGKFGGGSKDVEFYYRRKGQYITVFDYFTKVKRQTIDQPDLPLVNIGTRSKPTYMPPSCCKLVERPSQDALVLSVADLMQMVSEGITSHAKMPRWPSNGIDSNGIRSSGLRLPIADNMLNCQVTMTANALMTPCRVKMAPAIVYPGQKEFSPTSGSWTIDQTGIIYSDSNPSVRCKTAVLMIGCSRWAADEKIAKTLTALHDRLGSFGIDLTSTPSPLKVSMKGNKLSPKVEDDIKSKISTLLEDKTTAVVIMLSSRSKQVYEYVQKLCDVCLGIHSVCIDTYKLAAADNDNGYCFQTALKLNMKTGNRNQSLASPRLASVDLKNTMFVGIDVMIPPATTKEGTKPVVLIVSSINSDLSQWPSAVRVIDKQPLEQALSDLLSTRISLWMKKNKAASPANLIIYHKGLTEAVCASEISSLEQTIGKTMKQASFTLIAVNKDHHTKLQTLSSIDKAEEDKTILSGAMITRSWNGAKTWEFLIQGHQPQRIEEKASMPSTLNASMATLPTRYTVLYDDIFTTPKAKVELEDLTHDMQYLFGSSTAATSDTLPIHYLGLLRKRMELFLQPWYRPKKDSQKGRGKEPKLSGGGMSTETIRIHENIRDEMFYL
ncbi:MAG: hypothetical protein L6R38_007563 [Xanthoria sp. 2 TBL-2021]|nr:MAG: hypothetical protein L6R38_007563 [Xanthoria sp. 2 TBL-2021]